jgi:membrane protein implicated in regulation of membrane protease activity
VHMDDTWWTARSVDGAPIDAGMLIEVVEVDGATLLVKTVGES